MLRRLALLVGLTAACTTTSSAPQWGMQAAFVAFVPARTAVLPCLAWPTSIKLSGRPPSEPGSEGSTTICKRFDEAVLEGFGGQPFMKGFAPRLVDQLIAKGERKELLPEGRQLWRHEPGDCANCRSVTEWYSSSMSSRPAWRKWLADLSEIVRGADSILIPVVVWASEDKINDRGLFSARRSAGIELLLIDTNTAGLIWAGGREAAASSKAFATDTPPQSLVAPPWQTVMERLFIEELWRDYPGRQIIQGH
jgi:hypothetical protein